MKKTFLVILAVFSVFSCDLLVITGSGPDSLNGVRKGRITILKTSNNNDTAEIDYLIENTGKPEIVTCVFNLDCLVDLTPSNTADDSFTHIYKTVTLNQPIGPGRSYFGKESVKLNKVAGNDGTLMNNIYAKFNTVTYNNSQQNNVPGFYTQIPYQAISGTNIDFTFKFEYSPDFKGDFYSNIMFYIVNQKMDAYYFDTFSTNDNVSINIPAVFKLVDGANYSTSDFSLINCFNYYDRYASNFSIDAVVYARNDNAVEIKSFIITCVADTGESIKFREKINMGLKAGEAVTKTVSINASNRFIRKIFIESIEMDPNNPTYELVSSSSVMGGSELFK
jgi:hypothetical protein